MQPRFRNLIKQSILQPVRPTLLKSLTSFKQSSSLGTAQHFFHSNNYNKYALLFSFTLWPRINKEEEDDEDDKLREKIYNISLDRYKRLHKVLEPYFNNPSYVYKKCRNKNNTWLIVLKRFPETITNERRYHIVDVTKAKHRGSIFKVVMIVDINNPSVTTNEIYNFFSAGPYSEHGEQPISSCVTYKVGATVKPQFAYDTNSSVECGSGIHFFTDLLRAISYEEHMPSDFTGTWNYYWDDGECKHTAKYVNGRCIN